MDDQSKKLRAFFASLVTAHIRNPRIQRAFAAVERERFVGPAPWFFCLAGHDYTQSPDADPAFIYQDTLVALDPKRRLNIGQPSWHAFWLNAINPKEGETVLQVGAGTGYYTAILAQLVGQSGRVHAYEIDPALAAKACENLRDLPQVQIRSGSGIADDLPKVDAIYVCAAATQPSWSWLDAMRSGARLLFPLAPEGGLGGMLLLKRPDQGTLWPAKFVSRASFIGCVGLQEADEGRRLAKAFASDWSKVRSFRLDEARDATCWFAGDGWWLSTAAAEPE